ncbi:hypothetical protein [Blastococcus sp. SYSU DS0973]
MSFPTRSRAPMVAGVAFAILAVAGNALLGATPPLHGDAAAVAQFYADAPTRIALAMTLSLISVFFLAAFLGTLLQVLGSAGGPDAWAGRMAGIGGAATVALVAGGSALNSAGALRAVDGGLLAPESAVVFYDGGLALSGLAAPLAMAVLLAATALGALRGRLLPRWFGSISAVLATVGVVTPVSFLLALLFPAWVVVAGVVLSRRPAPTGEAVLLR